MIQQSGGQKKYRKHAGYKHVSSKNENNVHGDLGEKQAKKRPMIQITIFSPSWSAFPRTLLQQGITACGIELTMAISFSFVRFLCRCLIGCTNVADIVHYSNYFYEIIKRRL